MEKKDTRILGRKLALETTLKRLEETHGGRAGIRTWTLRYPPDRD
jgi:hypothetical protein